MLTTDIQECSDENGGCSTSCFEENGSYHCECDDGYELFEGDGFNGFHLPQGETGLRRGDRYFIDHTCVRKYQTPSYFHYGSDCQSVGKKMSAQVCLICFE